MENVQQFFIVAAHRNKLPNMLFGQSNKRFFCCSSFCCCCCFVCIRALLRIIIFHSNICMDLLYFGTQWHQFRTSKTLSALSIFDGKFKTLKILEALIRTETFLARIIVRLICTYL